MCTVNVVGMNKLSLAGYLALMTIWGFPALADTPLNLEYTEAASQVQRYEFAGDGLRRARLAEAVPVRGWQLADRAYFGQARVGDKWGLGFVFERGDTVYGVNHRGIEVRKRLF